MCATIDVQDFACDEGCLCEVEQGIDDFRYFADALDRVERFQKLMGFGSVHRRIDNARPDCIDSNALMANSIASAAVTAFKPPLGSTGIAAVTPARGWSANEPVILTI